MAGMGGDTNHREKKAEEKEDHGAVELLAEAAGLTQDKVSEQLFPVLFSKEAKEASAARKNRVFTVLIQFAENILKRKAELPKTADTLTLGEYRRAQAICQLEINKLRTDLLEIVSNQIITVGYILDSQIFAEFTQWFKHPDNLKRFDGMMSLISDLFWENGLGLLQYVAPARDAQVCQKGVGLVLDDGLLPNRTFKDSYGLSHFDESSTLGLIYSFDYLGFTGRAGGALRLRRSDTLESYVKQKQKHCEIYATPRQSSSEDTGCMLSHVKRR